jgi:hypothetical protein
MDWVHLIIRAPRFSQPSRFTSIANQTTKLAKLAKLAYTVQPA